MSLLSPGARLGPRYEILSILGQGGMGAVYKAQDLELNRTVALKVIRPEMASHPELLERFKREILLASQVTHKNVLRIHDLGEAGDIKFISMQYVEGSNLKQLLRKEGPLPAERALPLVRQIAEALRAAHEAEVVHRDLKPPNILLDGEGTAYIADFGISRSLDAGGTMTDAGMLVGTIDYMSPEQARGETPDHRSDIYSLGVMIYEILTGRLPFISTGNTLSVLMKRINEDAPSVRLSRPEVPAWLSGIVARAMQREPDARYQSVDELLHDLDRQRATRARRRNIARAAGIYITIAALLGGGGYVLYQWAVRPRQAVSPVLAHAPAIAFLPFENETNNPDLDWIRAGFPTLVSNGLRDSPEVRLLGGDRTQQTLADLKLPLSGTYNSFDLKRVASVLGAEVLVTGVVRRAGARYHAVAHLQRSGLQGMQEIGLEQVEGQGEEVVFSLADQLADRIAAALKVRLGRKVGTRQATTSSVEALRIYMDGLELIRSGRDLEAAKRLEQAVVEDSSFALAHALLSRTYSRLGHHDRALTASDQAMRNLKDVSPHEGGLIRARDAVLQNKLDEGIARYKELLRSYPQDADARFELAGVLEQSGDLPQATTELESCLSIDPKHTSAQYGLGRIKLRQGDSQSALKIFRDLLETYTQAGNEEGRGSAFLALGNVYKDIAQYGESLQYYRQSLEIGSKIKNNRGMAAALGNIAVVQRVQGQYADAVKSTKEALSLLTEIGDQRGIAAQWRDLGEIYEDTGQILEAQKCYQEALKTVRDLDDPALLALTSSSLGYVASVLGNYVEAYFFYQQALAKRREIGDKRDILLSVIEMGLMDQYQGRYDKALSYAAEAMNLAREIGEKAGAVVVSTNVGMIHDDQGSYSSAFTSLQEAVEGAREIGDKSLLASALVYLGGTLAHLGQISLADEKLVEADRLVKETENSALIPELLVNRAEVQCARGETTRCMKTLAEALKEAEELRDRRLILLARLSLGKWSLAAGRPQGRNDLTWVAEEAGKSALTPLHVRALSYLAATQSGRGLRPELVDTAKQVLEEGKPLKLRENLILASRALAMNAAAAGDREEAVRLYLDAQKLVQEMADGLEEAQRTALLTRKDLVKLAQESRPYLDRQPTSTAK